MDGSGALADYRHLPDAAVPCERVPLAAAGAGPRRRARFVKGPVYLDDVAAASAAHPRGVEMLLALKYKADVAGAAWAVPPRDVLDLLGFDSAARSRALAALERAGLAELRRRPGRPPLVRLNLNRRSETAAA